MSELRLLNEAEVISWFGDPRLLMRTDGSVDASWEQRILTSIVLPAKLPYADGHGSLVSTVRVHTRLAPVFLDLFRTLHTAGYWESIGSFGGVYCWRKMRNADRMSRHSWGIALDIDVLDNPFLAVVPRVDAGVKRIMLEHGFLWGGAQIWGGAFPWARRDPMHWEFADAERLRNPAA